MKDLKCDLIAGKTNEAIKNRLLENFKTRVKIYNDIFKVYYFP